MRRILMFAVIAGGLSMAVPGSGLRANANAETVVEASQAVSIQQANDLFIQKFRTQIATHEGDPAGRLFKDVRRLANVPAATFLEIMDVGYSRALGVACTYCHVDGDFASEDKRPKRAAREMQVLHQSINQQLAGLKNLVTDPADRSINCTTCHRGRISPLVK